MPITDTTRPIQEPQLVPCPVCGSTGFDVLYRPWRTGLNPAQLFSVTSGVRGTQQIVKCSAPECGMIFANPCYDEATILQGYAGAEEENHDKQFDIRVKSFLRNLRKYAAQLPPPGSRILDVGCAGGAFVRASEQFGYAAEGIEVSKVLVAAARQRDLNVNSGTLDTFQESNAFDLISLWDVLEHVASPRKVVQQCHRLLKPGGILLVNYPDVGTWIASLVGRHLWWYVSAHLHYFTVPTIRRFLESENFTFLCARPYTAHLEFGYLLDMAQLFYGGRVARAVKSIAPARLQGLPIPYYASQTTVLARKNK